MPFPRLPAQDPDLGEEGEEETSDTSDEADQRVLHSPLSLS